MRANAAFLMMIVAAAASYIAGSLQNKREVLAAEPVAHSRVLYYVDPMHPAYKSDKPGTAPDCGMALEPVYADDRQVRTRNAAPVPGEIAVSAETQRQVGIRVAAVEQTAGEHRVRLFGRVTPDETRVYKVNVGVDGFVRELSAVTTGAQVKIHQWLATFSAPEARQPIQAYLVTLDVLDRETKNGGASPQLALARGSVQQATDRLLTLGMSTVQVDEIGRTRLVPPNLRITAPADGFVIGRNVSAGEKIEKGAELYRIADLRRVWILLDVGGADAQFLRPGMTAQVKLPTFSTSIRAHVSRDVRPQFDPATQSSKVRLEADNPAFLLRPDMFVDVDVEIPRPSGITVPADAVVTTGLRNTVFVERSAGIFEPREVEIGPRFGDRLTILNGVSAGERIAVTGTFLLDSETRMKRHDQPPD
jgi:RND family efflux transporter MFP subunit